MTSDTEIQKFILPDTKKERPEKFVHPDKQSITPKIDRNTELQKKIHLRPTNSFCGAQAKGASGGRAEPAFTPNNPITRI